MTPRRAGVMTSERSSVRRLVQDGTQRLQAVGTPHARHEVEWLLSRLLGVRPLELYLRQTDVANAAARQFLQQIGERACGVPLQYLLGDTEFYGQRIFVAPGVFIPRPETESVIEAGLSRLAPMAARAGRPLSLLDLGTGSGCLAITLARHLPACHVVGVELSWKALCVARVNVARQRLSARIQLVLGRWAEPLRGPFDGIISNPPYVPSAQVDHLPLDVRQEPRLSLDGGSDGLRDLLHILSDAPRLLSPGGLLAMECGETQVDALVRVSRPLPWLAEVETVRDLAGRPRGILAVRAESGLDTLDGASP